MENPGLIVFDGAGMPSTLADESIGFRRGYAETAVHEISHQWFGNLVTMKWWDDVWLNEGFATWVTQAIVEEWEPTWSGLRAWYTAPARPSTTGDHTMLKSLVLCTSLVVSAAAFAGAPAQNHHCKMADGTTDTTKTHKQCTAAKGTWAKDDAAAPAAMPATAPAAAPAATGK